jgi:serine protease Do
MRSRCLSPVLIALSTLAATPSFARDGRPPDDDLTILQSQALQAGVARVAPSVAQIETSGGVDVLGSGPERMRRGVGPTTGLIVASDGYIISSAFNFANRPAAIFVALSGHKDRFVARVVATDQTRMLTLLKIDASGLQVPAACPKGEIRVGQSAAALGRTWTGPEGPPSVSIGIVSALGRIWGKAIQTDAKVSPVNYGGPLIDIQGRVLGVLVPASPRAQDETAGMEWYDSGIGFAIPLEDVNAVLPRLRQGHDLKRGLLGIVPKNPPEKYDALPEIASVLPDSAAARAGMRAGDIVTEVDGVRVVRQAQVMHAIGNKYEGDVVSVKIKRGKEEIRLNDLRLAGALVTFARGFLGILPMRDDPEAGVEVRYVYPGSSADRAGLKATDRVLKAGLDKDTLKPVAGRDHLMAFLGSMPAETEIQLQVRRTGVKDPMTLTAKLGEFPDAVPVELPKTSGFGKALKERKGTRPPVPPKEAEKKEVSKKPDVGLLKRSTAAGDHEYWLYIPENYDPNVSHALVVWLHPAGKVGDRDIEAFVNAWSGDCADRHFIVLGPKAENESGWLASEADVVLEEVQTVMEQYTIDPQRVVVHGMANGGQMAFYLGFHSRNVVRGVAVTGAALTIQPPDNLPSQRLSFFVVAGDKDPLAKSIMETKPKLAKRKFSVVYREIPDMARQYLDAQTLEEIIRWIDSLDRL